MAEPFLSEIRIMSFNFPPKGWALCNGQLLPINQNQPLFALLGTTYGGDGQVNFGLPDLRGRVPLHFGSGFSLGQRAGSESVTLNITQLPAHTHSLPATSGAASSPDPVGQSFAVSNNALYAEPTTLLPMDTRLVSNVGGSQPHTNLMPFLTLNFCIALQGIFPSQN